MVGMANEYFTKSISLDTEVWEALGVNPLSANQLLRVALGLDEQAVPSKRRMSRLEREASLRAAGDLTARAVERTDVDYKELEAMPTTHIVEDSRERERWRREIRPKGDKSR